jgi:hypothetical protein
MNTLLKVQSYIYDKEHGDILYLSVTSPPKWDAFVSGGTHIVCSGAVRIAALSILTQDIIFWTSTLVAMIRG